MLYFTFILSYFSLSDENVLLTMNILNFKKIVTNLLTSWWLACYQETVGGGGSMLER